MAVMVPDRGFDHERYAAMFLREDLCFVCNTHDKMGDVRYVPVTIHAVLLLDGDKMQKSAYTNNSRAKEDFQEEMHVKDAGLFFLTQE